MVCGQILYEIKTVIAITFTHAPHGLNESALEIISENICLDFIDVFKMLSVVIHFFIDF